MPLIVHFPPPRCSILCLFLKCHSPYLAIANSTTLPPHFLIFTLSVLLSALVCAWAPIHIWKNRCSFSADNTNRYTSHLLQRLMSVIYHNPIMGFSVCARVPVCVCVRVLLHISLVRTLFLPQCHCSPPTPTSVRLSQSISFRPSLRILSILLLLSPRGCGPIPLALHVCVQNKEHHQISNHQYQCSHMRYLWMVTTQLTHMDACVFVCMHLKCCVKQ